jgi:hypothetical protein
LAVTHFLLKKIFAQWATVGIGIGVGVRRGGYSNHGRRDHCQH